MTYFTEAASTATVNARMGEGTDPRLAEVMACLVRHLHDFAKEIQLTQGEWEVAIDNRARTGVPRMYFTIGTQSVVTDLSGQPIG